MNKVFRTAPVIAALLTLAIANAAFADGDDDGCSASEGPKPGHCTRSSPANDRGGNRIAQTSRIVCGKVARSTAGAAESLNRRLESGWLNSEDESFKIDSVSGLTFDRDGAKVTACATVGGRSIRNRPGY